VREAIETGTFQGDSAALLARRFGRCTTIELDPTLAARATERFADDPTIDVLQGSSRDRLAELDAIAASSAAQDHVVAVDDARLFGFAQELDPTMDRWPSLVTVLARIEEIGLLTYSLDDVIVGVPRAHAASFLEVRNAPSLRQNVLLFPIWGEIESASHRAEHAGLARRSVRAVRRRL
jgi:hypothetical protein